MKDIVNRLIDIADAGKRADGSDIPLGEDCREAAREITRLRMLLRATARLAHSVADDESGIDDNETYRAAMAASEITN